MHYSCVLATWQLVCVQYCSFERSAKCLDIVFRGILHSVISHGPSVLNFMDYSLFNFGQLYLGAWKRFVHTDFMRQDAYTSSEV